MATEGEVLVTDAVPSTRRLDTRTMTNGASHTVDREVHVIGDDTTPGATARVANAAPGFTDYGMVVRPAGMRRSGSLTYSAAGDIGSFVSSGTVAGTLISLGYLFHPSAVTGLVYRLVRMSISWVDGVGGNGAALELQRITAENGTPGGQLQTKQGHNNSNTASSAIFRTGATGAPTRTFSTLDGGLVYLGSPGWAEFGPAGEQDGQDYELQKSVAEGWEVLLTTGSVAPTVAAKMFLSAIWREETA